MQLLITIIIPNYNRAHLIGETLDSIIAQTHIHWECIIVDDGSTDNSEKVINVYSQKDERIKYYHRPSNKPKGANACRNYGLELSKGEFINWFDSDDLMHPDKLKLQVEALKNKNYDFCICKSYVFEGNIKNIISLKSDTITAKNPFEAFLTKKLIIPIQAPLFKKSFIFENDLYFDEALQSGQEWELFMRVFHISNNYVALSIPLDYIREHNNRISTGNESIRLWNYFLARFNIYQYYKEELSFISSRYLKNYFLMIYKLLLRQKAYGLAFKVWKMSLIGDKSYSIKQQGLLLLALVSFAISSKGDLFLTKVHRWDMMDEFL